MVAWAVSGMFPGIGFLCICVDPNAYGTAQEFSKLYFSSAPDSLLNGYCESQSDFPNFEAQLGCQGFIIFNASHQIAVARTLPWNQNRQRAFWDVEGKLSQFLAPSTENPLQAPVGQYVKITGLKSAAGAELNGQHGEVAGSTENGRIVVKLGGCTKSFLPANLVDAADAPIGRRVKVKGLTSAKGMSLNGQVGEVRGSLQNGRYIIKFTSGTISLQKDNLEEVLEANEGSQQQLTRINGVHSVNHQGMDDQHDLCITALNELSQKLSKPALRRVRDELASHFADEEALLQNSRFGTAACCEGNSEFSALGSHVKDHKRIITMAEDALETLQNACDGEGTVPVKIVADLCTAFVDHAELYDSLYADKLASPTA